MADQHLVGPDHHAVSRSGAERTRPSDHATIGPGARPPNYDATKPSNLNGRLATPERTRPAVHTATKPGGPDHRATMTIRRRGPWTPSTRFSSMSLVAEGPEIQVRGRPASTLGRRRATASGTSETT